MPAWVVHQIIKVDLQICKILKYKLTYNVAEYYKLKKLKSPIDFI